LHDDAIDIPQKKETGMIVTALLLLAATASPPPPVPPRPGDKWVKVTYDVVDGEAMGCTVLETNIDTVTGQNVCDTIVTRWRFERAKGQQTVTRYVVVKPSKG
jgi:hypothetical protein